MAAAAADSEPSAVAAVGLTGEAFACRLAVTLSSTIASGVSPIFCSSARYSLVSSEIGTSAGIC